MQQIEDRYYFHKNGNTSIIGVLNTDGGEWKDKYLKVFNCEEAEVTESEILLTNTKINALLYPGTATILMDWVKISKEQIPPNLFLSIGARLDGKAEVEVFDLPGDF